MKPQPRQLHRDGRSAGAWMAGTCEVPGGSEERHRIHARMLREIFVLKTDRRIDQRWRDIVERCPDSVFLIRGERDAKHVAASIAHPCGKIDSVELTMASGGRAKRRRVPSRETQRDAAIDFGCLPRHTGNRKEGGCARRAWNDEFFTFRNPVSGIRNYFVTLIFPPSPRAFTLRSYIDSAKTGGTTKFPRLHDLIW